MSDLLITQIRRYKTADGQEFATIEEARLHAAELMGEGRRALLQQALTIADLLEAGDITLNQFNNNRLDFARLLRALVRRIVRG